MPKAVVKRAMKPFLGGEVAVGDVLTDEQYARLTPQTLKALVNNGALEVEGMASGGETGMGAHLKAKVDSHHDRLTKAEATVKTLQASNDDLARRLTALEGGKAAAKQSRRSSRQGGTE